jgi:hypothetical protein
VGFTRGVGILIVAVVTAVVFVVVERRKSQPLSTSLLATSLAADAVISQSTAGAAEMGLGVILPLLLILASVCLPGRTYLRSLPLIHRTARTRRSRNLFARHTLEPGHVPPQSASRTPVCRTIKRMMSTTAATTATATTSRPQPARVMTFPLISRAEACDAART